MEDREMTTRALRVGDRLTAKDPAGNVCTVTIDFECTDKTHATDRQVYGMSIVKMVDGKKRAHFAARYADLMNQAVANGEFALLVE
jgi:hypothetical protein